LGRSWRRERNEVIEVRSLCETQIFSPGLFSFFLFSSLLAFVFAELCSRDDDNDKVERLLLREGSCEAGVEL
jgi:hypothetical protein